MPYSPKESQPSTLQEDFLILIQKVKAEWLGNLPTECNGSSLSTFHSGIEALAGLIEATVSPGALSAQMMDALDWGDQSLDLPTEAAKLMKRVILDVIAEFGEDRQSS